RKRFGRGRRRIVAALDRLELRAGRGRALEQLGEGVGAVAAPQVGEALELGFDVLEPPGLRLQAVEEGAQLRRRLAERELGRTQRLTRGRELGGESLERATARPASGVRSGAPRSAPPPRRAGAGAPAGA